jgi:hypothetical protein
MRCGRKDGMRIRRKNLCKRYKNISESPPSSRGTRGVNPAARNGERGGGCHATTRVGKRPQPGEGCTLDILPLRQAPPSPAPHGSVCLLLDLGDRVKLHPEDVCAIGRARVGMSGGMEGGACAARGRVRHARTCSPYNPYPRPHRSRGRQSTSVPTVSLQGDGEVSKRRIGAVDASTQVAASAAWDRAKDATSAAREALAYEIESLRRGRRPVSHTPASARYSQCTCPRFPQPAGQRGMRAVSEGTRAGAVAQGFSNAPAPTLSSGRAFAA